METENTKSFRLRPFTKAVSVPGAAALGYQVAFVVRLALKPGCTLELPGEL